MSKQIFNNQGKGRELAPGGVSTEWLISANQNKQNAAFQAQRVLSELGIKGRSLTEQDIIGFIFDNLEGVGPFQALLSFQSAEVRDIFGVPAAVAEKSIQNISDPAKDPQNAMNKKAIDEALKDLDQSWENSINKDAELARKLLVQEERENARLLKEQNEAGDRFVRELQEKEKQENAERLEKQAAVDAELALKLLEAEEAQEAERLKKQLADMKLARELFEQAEKAKQQRLEEQAAFDAELARKFLEAENKAKQAQLEEQFAANEQYIRMIQQEEQAKNQQFADDLELATFIAKQELAEKNAQSVIQSPGKPPAQAQNTNNFGDILNELLKGGSPTVDAQIQSWNKAKIKAFADFIVDSKAIPEADLGVILEAIGALIIEASE